MLREYRDLAYLENLTEAEYMLFADEVAAAIEQNFPVYTTFIEMPAVNDTVQVYVVTTIVDQLNADVRNMRHLFPYNSLVQTNVLPSGLDRVQQNAFYRCLAQKVNYTYPDVASFVNAMLSDTTSMSTINQLQQQCATDLFGWEIDIDEETLKKYESLENPYVFIPSDNGKYSEEDPPYPSEIQVMYRRS